MSSEVLTLGKLSNLTQTALHSTGTAIIYASNFTTRQVNLGIQRQSDEMVDRHERVVLTQQRAGGE